MVSDTMFVLFLLLLASDVYGGFSTTDLECYNGNYDYVFVFVVGRFIGRYPCPYAADSQDSVS